MQALKWFWPRIGARSVRLAWGLTPAGTSWALVGLARVSPGLARVHASTILQGPADAGLLDSSWLSPALAEMGRGRRLARHRLGMSMSAPDLVTGEFSGPANLSPDGWPAEVQLEVAQALGLPPQEVNFDFHSEPGNVDGGVRLRWAGCPRSRVSEYQRWSAGAGWQLVSVEPASDAAQRAANALVGGLPRLLQQAPQDWQFRLNLEREPMKSDGAGQQESRTAAGLLEALATPVGPRLVAAGLALKAWL